MPLIDSMSNVGVAAAAEHGRGAGIRVHAREVRGSQLETAILVCDSFRVVQKKGAFGFSESPLLSTEYEGAEFEAGVHIREKRRQVGSEATVLEIEQAAHPAAGRNGLEESSRSLVRVNARWR